MNENDKQAEPVAVDHSDLIKRIDAAIDRVTQGRGLMSIPADPRSDVDLVLSECKALLQGENPPFWATDFHPAPAVAVNEQMIEENDVVSIPREVVDFIADRLAVKLFDDPNGPMFLVCDGCGESVRTGYRGGKPIAHESDIKHDLWCPLVWVKNFLND